MENLIKLDHVTPFGASANVVSGRFGMATMIATLWSGLGRRYRNRRAIAELAALDDRLLRDIGLVRSEIEFAVRYGRRMS